MEKNIQKITELLNNQIKRVQVVTESGDFYYFDCNEKNTMFTKEAMHIGFDKARDILKKRLNA